MQTTTRVLKLSFLLAIVLTACSNQSPHRGVPCNQPGTLNSGRVENDDGFAHRFMIYLPPCYEEETERSYPTIYLFPGRNGGPSDWFNSGLAEVADALILSSEIPPFIIVGLDNTDSDMQGENFLLRALPFVERNYRVIQSREYRGLGGGSQGGAPAYRLALQNPDLFGSAALFGSGAISGEGGQIRVWIEAIPIWQRPRFFFNTGFEDPFMLERAEALIEILDQEGIGYQAVFTEGEHSYAYWVSNFGEYLRWLAQEW